VFGCAAGYEHSLSIAYLSFDALPSPKGAAVHIDAFARALGEAFGDVELVTIAAAPEPGAPPRRAVDDAPWSHPPERRPYSKGVTHTSLRPRGPNVIARALSFRTQLRRWWGKRHFDVVHFRSIFEGYPVARRKQQLCEKLVYEVNGLPSIELKYHYPSVADDIELMAKLRAQEQCCIDAADVLLTPSSVTADELERRGARQVEVIPNGVDEKLFGYRTPRTHCPFRLLYVGTLTSWQGLSHAIDAVVQLRGEGREVSLVGIGPAPKRRRWALAEQAPAWVELLQPLPQAELVAHYHAAHAAIVPLAANDRNLVQGCCPLKLLEAMAVGAPAIVSDLPVTRALADDGEVLFTKPGSSKSIASAVARLMDEPELAPSLAAAARARIEHTGTWRHATDRLIRCYPAVGD
jgi:glycosyltransferase involved in cell wall biosynthesis